MVMLLGEDVSGEVDLLPGWVVTPEVVGGLTSEQLEREMQQLAGHLAAATASFLVMVGEYDARGAWGDWQALSCAHWLGFRCGVGIVAAREQVRVARALRSLPVVTSKFLAGEVSYSKVRAITRVAHGNNEADLVEMAQWGTAAQIERACSALRRCQVLEDEERAIAEGEDVGRALRSFTWGRDDVTGDVVGRVRVPVEDAEVLLGALDAVVRESRRAAKGAADGDVEVSLAQERVDALVELARHYLASPPGEEPSCGTQAEIVVGVDATALASFAGLSDPADPADPADSTVPTDSTGETDSADSAVPTGATDSADSGGSGDSSGADAPGAAAGLGGVVGVIGAAEDAVAGLAKWPVLSGRGQRLSIAALQRLSCDAGMRLVVRSADGTVLDAAPHRRAPSRALRRWLLRRDRGCRFPGCGRRHGLQAHHIVHWEHDGPTVRENLLMLCTKHHWSVHEGGWGLTGPASAPRFARPDGVEVSERPPRLSGSLGELVEAHRRHGVDIAADGAGSRWVGDELDWDCFFAAFADGPRAVRPDPAAPEPDANAMSTPGTG
ncbi:MAG: HNH endonuclease signature motif containing protein [Microthrixaceae bacterium]